MATTAVADARNVREVAEPPLTLLDVIRLESRTGSATATDDGAALRFFASGFPFHVGTRAPAG